MASAIEVDELISVEDASLALGLTKQAITGLIRADRIHAEKVGNQWILRKTDINRYLDKNNLAPAPSDHERLENDLPDIVSLSFFSGALGLDLGMEHAGFSPLLYCECDRKCRMTIDTMRPNAALIGDITEHDAVEIRRLAHIPDGCPIDVIFGGPPCQAFSTAGARRAFDDQRGNVFLRYLSLVKDLKPKYVVIENVRGLLSTPWPTTDGGPSVKGGAMKRILTILDGLGYSVSFNLYNAANFGAAQIRERVVLIGKLGGKKVPYLTPTNSKDESFGLPRWKTFGEVVSDLANRDSHHAEFPEKRLQYFKLLREGQYWKDLPSEVQAEAMGKAYALSGGKTGFYRRIAFDQPCPTLVTSPTMPATDLCHPTEDRPLSIEEYMRVQGFPDDWIIRGNLTDMYRQVGNAVPLALGEAIGKTILSDMSEEPTTNAYEGFPYSRYKHTSDITWN